jgi:predicted MPP superfamily phosphohydrolase
MSHGPAVTDSLDGRASLVVAGHTHGGQIFLPFVTQRLLTLRWLRGAYEVDGRPLYVTSGVGNSVLPIRFGVPPELVLLTVRGPGG